MDRAPAPPARPSPLRLGPVDFALLAFAVGALIAVVFAPERLGLLKAALAFWGASCVAMVGVNLGLRAAAEVVALRRRIREIEDELADVKRILARIVRGEDATGLADAALRDRGDRREKP